MKWMCYGINDSQMRDKENKKATANDPSIVSTLKCIRKRRDKKKEQNVNSKILITTRNEFAKIKIFFFACLNAEAWFRSCFKCDDNDDICCSSIYRFFFSSVERYWSNQDEMFISLRFIHTMFDRMNKLIVFIQHHRDANVCLQQLHSVASFILSFNFVSINFDSFGTRLLRVINRI